MSKNTKVPDEFLTFFSELFNIKKTALLKNYYENIDEQEAEEKPENEYDERAASKSAKLGSIFQIKYYNLHSGTKKTPLHIMNAVELYEKCKSRELITSFNKSGICISYGSMKKHRNDLAKLAIYQSLNFGVPLPSHFSPDMFTIAAFDNFDHSDKNTLSGKSSTHNTVMTLFEEIPLQRVSKPTKSNTNLNAIKTLSKLASQKVSPFKSNENLIISPSFKVDENLYQNEAAIKSHETMEFIVSAMKGIASNTNEPLPSWAGIQALLSSAKVPLMQAGFLPFLPYPVTEYSTVLLQC